MADATAERALRGVAAVAVVAAVLVGCTGNPPPEPSPTPEPTVESTPTPTPTETAPPETVTPERPAAMDEVSVEGAEAVARYFLELYPYVYATGDLTEWKALSHPECVFCASVVENVEEQVVAGNTSRGSIVTVRSVVARTVTADTWFAVDTEVTQSPSVEFGPDGEVVSENREASDHTMVFAVVRTDPGGWQVRAVQVDEAPDS